MAEGRLSVCIVLALPVAEQKARRRESTSRFARLGSSAPRGAGGRATSRWRISVDLIRQCRLYCLRAASPCLLTSHLRRGRAMRCMLAVRAKRMLGAMSYLAAARPGHPPHRSWSRRPRPGGARQLMAPSPSARPLRATVPG